jgi:membrane-associated protease RseP (regulator of RpoE activity)
MALLQYVLFVKEIPYSETVFILFSGTLINIILAALIVFRLIFHQRYVRNVLGGGHESLYTNVMTMWVESSGLIVVASVIYTAMFFAVPQWVRVPCLLYPHICVGGLKLDDIG